MSELAALQVFITDFQQLVVQSDGASVASVVHAGRLLWAECSIRQAPPALLLCMEYVPRWGSSFWIPSPRRAPPTRDVLVRQRTQGSSEALSHPRRRPRIRLGLGSCRKR